MNVVSWRVVVCDCLRSEAGEVLYTGRGSLHDGVSAAFEARREKGPEVGIGVDWLYELHGKKWNRYLYLLTGTQRIILDELDRRERIESTRRAKVELEAKIKAAKAKRKRGRSR